MRKKQTIDNVQLTSEGAAQRHFQNHFPTENAFIVNYQLSIVNSFLQEAHRYKSCKRCISDITVSLQ